MDRTKWSAVRRLLVLLAATALVVAAVVMALNVYADPFGAFGDRFLSWWGYDQAQNPKVGKLGYLQQHPGEYDAYLVGASNLGNYPMEQLNDYFDASFYDLRSDDGNMKDAEAMCRYVVEHGTVKQLVLSVSFSDAVTYGVQENRWLDGMPWQADQSSSAAFYGKYLLASPRYALDKLRQRKNQTYLQSGWTDPATGAMDTSRADTVPIGALEPYLEANPEFDAESEPALSMDALDACMESVQSIVDLCRENEVALTVCCPPVYQSELDRYSAAQQAAFRTALAEITDYWDFTQSASCKEPRYFYDRTHFRRAMGTMLLAAAFDDESVYFPEELGRYVEQGTQAVTADSQSAETGDTVRVPILMYHHVAQEGEGSDTISAARLESHMAALRQAGYTAVTFEDLRAWVEQGSALPEHPVVITFDDGYESNVTLACPILKQYGMKATIFVVGVSVGKDTYKDTGTPMLPHFSLEEAQSMVQSGVITVESHGYDIHQVAGRDTAPVRSGAIQLEGESDWDYAEFLKADCRKMEQLLCKRPGVLAYPYGRCSELSENVLREMGIWATVTIEGKTNTLVRGLPQCLRQMGRYYMSESITGQALVDMLEAG